jgi:FkbM family methyltransferase
MNLQGTKVFIKHLIGRDLKIRPQLNIPLEHYGTDYGGWSVPAGTVGADSVVYSFGIGEDASWDLGLIAAKGCTVHGFDPTPKSLAWAKDHITESKMIIHPLALSHENGSIDLWLPANPEHVSASCRPSKNHSEVKLSVDAKTVTAIMEEFGHDHVDVLKMDIEGAEYPVIAGMIGDGSINRIGVLLIEFHHWMPAFSLQDTKEALKKLEGSGFVPAWVSPSGHEVLFARKK